jgi:DNA-binding CsgD family transcriptional regulator
VCAPGVRYTQPFACYTAIVRRWIARLRRVAPPLLTGRLVRATLIGNSLLVLSVPVGDEPLFVQRGLTPGERQVVRLAAEGLSNAAIARRRGRSPRTVANQLAAAYRKLGITSRRELQALREGRSE